MSVPTPEFPLENVCSTIFDNTLFTYSPTAFQSLELTKGATWKTLAMGVSTSGAVCVKTTPVNNGNASALWIVGGQSNETDYQGLQRYSFMDQTWETIKTMDAIARDRLWHGAAYLNKSDSILMYAGTQVRSKWLLTESPFGFLDVEKITPYLDHDRYREEIN